MHIIPYRNMKTTLMEGIGSPSWPREAQENIIIFHSTRQSIVEREVNHLAGGLAHDNWGGRSPLKLDGISS